MKITTVLVAAFSLFAPALAFADTAETFDVSDDFVSSVSNSELDQNRGEGSSFQIATTAQEAVSTGNYVIGGTTGDNVATNGAFEGANGIMTMIQNSGNNVIVQSATTINMTLN